MSEARGARIRLVLVLCLLSIALAQTPAPPQGYSLEPLVTDLRSPTQMTFGPDGRLYIAQLSGGENAGTGQVVVVDLVTGAREVVLRDLFKPTGLAVTETDLWVMAGNRLLRAPFQGGEVGPLQIVLRDLPNNGRSEGTLTLTEEGALLYETSGQLTAQGAQPGSGVLWQLEPGAERPEPLATGLKGAYAHTFSADGTLYSTEIGDDWMDGSPPPDEVNVIEVAADYGWPTCYGRQRPARNTGGTREGCQKTRAPLALFPRGATPTSVVVSPFDHDNFDHEKLLVAFWARAQVVQVDARTGETTPFLSDIPFPQHLLSDGETLLVSSFSRGVVYRLERNAQSTE